ncbi:hypothetical protein PV327_007853 [Microctonus hyperodae]|uniref:Tektin n=1 Tax=Microctonus hyperodae TaxID=165561 RepID=A0AA39G0R8_MICHY|nr:hypothetical protein PV327_007853 [Microctonus hyperodae]
MTEPTFCVTVNSEKKEKYRESTPINKFDMANTTVTLNCVKNPMWSSPTNQFAPKNIKYPSNDIESEMILETPKADINDENCPLTTSLAASDNCSSPLSSSTKLSETTETTPAADNKYTIPRYTADERKSVDDKLSNDANKIVQDAKDILFAERMLDRLVYSSIDVNQAENQIRIQDRARIVYYWKRELEKNNKEVIDEIEKIQNIIQQLLRCNRSVELIINIDNDIQKVRSMRLPPDFHHDSLTYEIIKEKELCAEVINLNTRYIDETKKQLRELKDAKQRLEHDWSDKKSANDIDTACLNIKNTSSTILWKPGCVRLPDGQSTPASYEYFVKETIIYVKAALAKSRVFRENVKNAIRKSAKDLREQANFVDAALMKNIDRASEGIKKLERALEKCLKSLTDTESLFKRMNDGVRKLDAPMKCAQTKLDMRSKRENVENCRDVPQFTLIDEVKSISEYVSALLSQSNAAEKTIEALTKSRKQIEKQIETKQRTLWVDNESCKLFRSYYPTDQALLGYE